jgi:hypothetical protein
MTLRMLAAALAALAIAVPAASAAVPAPDLQTTVQQQKQDLRSPDARDAAAAARQDLRSPDARDAAVRSPGHPSGHAGVAAADPVRTTSGSSVDWAPILIAAGLGVFAICMVGLVATRRRTPRAVV